jgi:hypothetical protein
VAATDDSDKTLAPENYASCLRYHFTSRRTEDSCRDEGFDDRVRVWVSIVQMGTDLSGRRIFIADAARLEDLPEQLSPLAERFVLLLAVDADPKPERLCEVLKILLEVGCVYLCAWGPGCQRVEIAMDNVFVNAELKGEQASTVITTSHQSESLDDAAWFVLNNAYPDDCNMVILAAIAHTGWLTLLGRAIHEHLRGNIA